MKNFFEIPDKLELSCNEDVNAVITTWTSYTISNDDFKKAILNEGLYHAKQNKCKAWIVDSSKATGLFKKDQLDFIDKEVFPELSKNGIEYFFSIKPEDSLFTELTVKRFTSMTSSHNMKLIEVNNVDEAINWLKDNVDLNK